MSPENLELEKVEPKPADTQSIRLGVFKNAIGDDYDDDAVLRANGHDTVMPLLPVFTVAGRISLVTQVSLYLSLAGYLTFFIVSFAMHQQTQHGSFVVASGQGNSGWNDGTAWMLAISNAMYAFGGTDGVINISEEIPRRGRRVPQVLIMTMIIGLVTSVSMFIVFMFFISDMDAIRPSPLPSLELLYQVTGSRSVTLGLFVLLLAAYLKWLPILSTLIQSEQLSQLPRPHHSSRLPIQLPLRSPLLASTTAFNSIITSAVLFLNITYTIPCGLLLLRSRDTLPPRYLKLAYIGCYCNIFSVLWIVALCVLICMPPNLPVELGSMSFVCVILVGVIVIINCLWAFIRRHSFEGPHIDWGFWRQGRSRKGV
ncbi:choline transporter [Aspergillus affinis]|uniref:choline transporter n=1 Tax=Aspergillus affinis TaxID=1070780 RepID=UPI0022FF4238|nr:choline transporter [Aspergillus affinis]KAI9037558.1 choline transporter [Aspergillus affinis]